MAYQFKPISGVANGGAVSPAPAASPYPFQAVSGIGRQVAPYTQFSPTYDAPIPKGTSTYDGPVWWQTALGSLGSIGSTLTDGMNNNIKAAKQTFQNGGSFWDGMLAGSKAQLSGYGDLFSKGWDAQMDAWQDVPEHGMSLAAMPGWGFFNGLSDNAAHGSDVLNTVGVENPWAAGIGGFAIDVAVDPLTYLTFGGGSVSKASNLARVAEATSIAGEAGLKTTGKVLASEIPRAIENHWYDWAIDAGKTPAQARKIATEESRIAAERIETAGKNARYTAQNDAVSFDVPFTNFSGGIARKPSALRIESPKLGVHGPTAINRLTTQLGMDAETTSKFVQRSVGKTNLEDVTLQEFRHIQDELGRYAGHAENATIRAPFARTAEELAQVKSPLDTFNFQKFIPDAGGTSKWGAAALDRVRAFNPRYVGNRQSGALVNDAGNAIQDAMGARRAATSKLFDQRIGEVAPAFKNLSEAEQKAVTYTLEGEFPRNFDMSTVDMDKVNTAAAALRPEYQAMMRAERGVGALDKSLPNYAPHVLNKSDSEVESILQKYADDPELQKLSQVSAANSFNRSRKSFKTMAALDNYLADLGDQIAKEADPAKLAALQTKFTEVGELFERDPFKAYQMRLAKSFKTVEMGKLYQQLGRDGLIIEKDTAHLSAVEKSLFQRVTGSEARALNIPDGSYMHKDVLKALTEANKIFNNEGLNKFVENATAITNIWKGLTTTIRPVHHFNNLMGNIFNNGIAGVGVKDYRRATGVINRIARNKPKQEDLDLMDRAFKAGIFGQSHSDEYRRLFQGKQASKLRKVEDFAQNNKVTAFMRKWLGDTVDEWSRLAHFASIERKTGSSKMAAESVRKYLFNYGEQTSADRFARLFVPFWTWTKNNIPLQLNSLMKQPRYFQAYQRLQDASFEVQGEDRNNQEGFIRDSYFMTPWGTLRNPRAPITDLNNLDGPQAIAKFAASSASPLLRIPVEYGIQRQLFNDKPITNKAEYALQQMPIFNDMYKLGTGQNSIIDFLIGRELEANR